MATDHRLVPLSKAEIEGKLKEIITRIWNKRWESRGDCRQTKIFFPKVDLKKSSEITKMSRENISRVIRAITGHDFRRKHEALVTGSTDTQCRFCEDAVESSAHIINDCPRLAGKRLHYLNRPLGRSVTPDWEPQQLAAFLSDPIISEMEAPVRVQ